MAITVISGNTITASKSTIRREAREGSTEWLSPSVFGTSLRVKQLLVLLFII